MANAIHSKFPPIARMLLGLVFFVFGLNGFLGFIPQPPLPEAGGAFMGALAATGYMLPLIKGTEVIAGLMLLSGRFVPLALVLLAPVIVNIVLFHVVLAPTNMVMAVVLLALEGYLAWAYRDAFAGVLNGGARPSSAAAPSSGTTRTVSASA
ncbi:MAG: DoxX family protein [Deltaproteobacteria bacterium]|nr:DoxX family protein [Deltaproteobacteria bacterium]